MPLHAALKSHMTAAAATAAVLAAAPALPARAGPALPPAARPAVTVAEKKVSVNVAVPELALGKREALAKCKAVGGKIVERGLCKEPLK